MRGGTKTLLITACASMAACAANTGKLEVRAIADPAARLRNGAGDVSHANALLAFGSTGLALEEFRKIAREQPSNADAMAGIAACYAAMGRNDVAESNYEAALALAPHDPRLLNALAGVFDREGKTLQALQARTDARADAAPSAPPAVAAAANGNQTAGKSVATAAVATTVAASTVTIELPPARPFDPVAPSPKPVDVPGPSTITVALPPARPAPRRAPDRIALAEVVAQTTAPRLERVSPGEVALVTGGKSLWQTQLVARTQTSTTVRWIPIQSAEARPNIQLLNAARRGGLAARARVVLLDRGWRKIEIGDSTQRLDRSIVYYPAARSALGHSLAAQFGIRALAVREGGVLTVLLGRDAAGVKAAQRHG